MTDPIVDIHKQQSRLLSYSKTTEKPGSKPKNFLNSHAFHLPGDETPGEWKIHRALFKIMQFWSDWVWVKHRKFLFAGPKDWKDKNIPDYRTEILCRGNGKGMGYHIGFDIPKGSIWNFASENVKSFLPSDLIPDVMLIPTRFVTKKIGKRQKKIHPNQLGHSNGWRTIVTYGVVMILLNQFTEERLSKFGPFEDAMAAGQLFLFYYVLSLNSATGLPSYYSMKMPARSVLIFWLCRC